MPKEPTQLPASEQETQIQTPSLMDKLKIHKFKVLAGVLAVLVFIGVAFGTYKLDQKQILPSPQPTPTPTIEATPTSDPTADWKTYTNPWFNFELKYPPDWGIEYGPEPDNEWVSITAVDFRAPGTIISHGDLRGEDVVISVSRSKERALFDIVQEQAKLEDLKAVTYELNGIKGYLIKRNLPHWVWSEFFFEKNYLIFEIAYAAWWSVDSTDLGTIDLILSTFKFLEEKNCNDDDNCPGGYFCDFGVSCGGPPLEGKSAECEELGTGTCFKECKVNSDCPKGNTCQEFNIPSGDAIFLKKGCR